MEDNCDTSSIKCSEARLISDVVPEERSTSHQRSTANNSYFTTLRRNDLFIMLLVLVQAVQSSWAAANVMVQSELSDGQFSRWISLDNLKFKETSLTPEAG